MRSLPCLLVLPLVLAACQSTAEDQMTGGSPMDEAAMMEMMTQLALPNENHEVLNDLVGDWDTKMTMWMTPEAPPMVEHGSMTSNWVLNGRFVEQRFLGSMMGQAFTGLGVMGYDRVREAYVGFWADSTGTQMMDISVGQANETGDVITMHRDYMMPGMETTTMREVVTIHGSNHNTFEIYAPLPGPPGAGLEYKMLEIQYHRR